MMGEHQKVFGIITVCVVTLLPGKLSAEDDGIQSEKLQVAVDGLGRVTARVPSTSPAVRWPGR
jgi:hypothetical protein